MIMIVVFAAFAHLVGTALALPVGDEVKSLPGWPGELPSKMYSGYIDVGENLTHHIHYVFVESTNDPSNDPVVLWVQGGPGGSSLEGMHMVPNVKTLYVLHSPLHLPR